VVSTDEASCAASARRCAFAETSAKTTYLGPTVDSLIGQLLVGGFDVPPLMLSSAVVQTANGSSAVKDTSATEVAQVKVMRAPSGRRRLGRSRSAAIMSTATPSNETRGRGDIARCSDLAKEGKQPQRLRSTSQTDLRRCVNGDGVQDWRCVIL